MKLTNLTDTQYLIYYLKRSKKTVEDYENFINSVFHILEDDDIAFIDKVYQTQHINIRPYLFTVYTNTPDAFKSFMTYVHHYLQKAEYSQTDIESLNLRFDKNQACTLKILLDLLKSSNLMLVSLLFLMQYYFL
jgi:hypothetical protein